MDASVIWYRSRPDIRLAERLGELLDCVGAVITDEQTTIRSELFPPLLASALGRGGVCVIVGGFDLRYETDNIVFMLSRCISMPLEYDEQSRSSYIYDNFRNKILPSFEAGVLFPSRAGGAEGIVLSSGKQTIILLPWLDEEHFDMLELMEEYLPQLISEAALLPEEPEYTEPEPEPVESKPEPDYLRIAEEKRLRREEDELKRQSLEFSAEELKKLFSQQLVEKEPLAESNRASRNRISGNIENKKPAVSKYAPPNFDERQREKKRRKREKPAAPVHNSKAAGYIFVGRASIIMLLSILLVAIVYVGFNYYEPAMLSTEPGYQAELSELYGETTERGNLPFGALTKFARLYAENSDIGGYLSIPGTELAQPVMICPSSEPTAYSYLDFYGMQNDRGSLYFDIGNKVSDSDYFDFNTVIYGKSPTDGSMFSELHGYTDKNYLSEHPLINMDTIYKSGQWLIFAVCCVSEDTIGEFDYADTDFIGQFALQTHLYNLYIRSMFYTQTEVLPTDRILTLVTDSGEFTGSKLIVCARLVREDEDISRAGEAVIANDSCLMPEMWYELNDADKPAVPRLVLPTTSTASTTTIATSTTTGATGTSSTAGQISTTTTTSSHGNPTTLPAETFYDTIRITSGGRIITGSAAEVLAMIIEAEMSSGSSLEALKAQAVAAYTYYLYSGGEAKAPSFPTKSAGERAKAAAAAVAGQYMTYNGLIIYTPYYAISAGNTANNADINGTALPYLVSVDSSVDADVSGYRVVKQVEAVTVQQKVLQKKGIDLSTIEDKSQWFEVLERDENDLYVKQVRVGDSIYRGNTLHQSILGYSCLRSPCFWIEYDESTDMFIFTSLGYGTGVGMSQTAADAYADEGCNYVWILEHFYKGVKITK